MDRLPGERMRLRLCTTPVVLEEVAKMARLTESVNPDVKPAPDNIKEKHFYRKHGANAYYGQN